MCGLLILILEDTQRQTDTIDRVGWSDKVYGKCIQVIQSANVCRQKCQWSKFHWKMLSFSPKKQTYLFDILCILTFSIDQSFELTGINRIIPTRIHVSATCDPSIKPSCVRDKPDTVDAVTPCVISKSKHKSQTKLFFSDVATSRMFKMSHTSNNNKRCSIQSTESMCSRENQTQMFFFHLVNCHQCEQNSRSH